MIKQGSTFTIEREPKVEVENIVSNVFDTTTFNNSIEQQQLTADIISLFSKIKDKGILEALRTQNFDQVVVEVTKEDLVNMLREIFPNNAILDTYIALVRAINKVELQLLNILVALHRIVTRIADTLCTLAEAFAGATLSLPKIKLVDSMVGLILLLSVKCMGETYTVMISSVTDDGIKRHVNAALIRSTVALGNVELLNVVLNHTSSTELVKYYPTLIDIILTGFNDGRTEYQEGFEWERWADGWLSWDNEVGSTPDPTTKSDFSWPKLDGGLHWSKIIKTKITRGTKFIWGWKPVIIPEDWYLFQTGLDNISYVRIYNLNHYKFVTGDKHSLDYRRYSAIYPNQPPATTDYTQAPTLPTNQLVNISAVYNTLPPRGSLL